MKKRILFVTNNLYKGGAEKILQTLLSALDPQKYDITLYSVLEEKYDTNIYPDYIEYHYIFKRANEVTSKLETLKIKAINKSKILLYKVLPPKYFYKLFIKGQYNIEIAFIEGYSTRIVSGSPNRNSRKLAWVHIDLSQNHWSKIAYSSLSQEIKAYQVFDNVIGVSQSVLEGFVRVFGKFPNLTVKYNPIDAYTIDTWSQNGPTDLLNEEPYLISAGRLENQKGFDRLLKVIKALKNNSLPFHLKLLGEGSQRQLLEAYICENNLQDQVELLGFKDNPYPFMKNAFAYISSSRTEGFSTVVSEALILGVPVVATKCAGMQELLGNSEYGLITENNTEALYEGVFKMITNEKFRSFYIEKSKERGKSFKLENAVAEIENLWSYD